MAGTETNDIVTPRRGTKRSNKHLTPDQILQMKSRREEFIKEHGEPIYIDIFKANLQIVNAKEISIIQQTLLDLELNDKLDIKTTMSKFIYPKRCYAIRVHSTVDKDAIIKIIQGIGRDFVTHTSDQKIEDEEVIQLWFPFYLGHMLDGGRLPILLKKKLSRSYGSDVCFNIYTPPYLSQG